MVEQPGALDTVSLILRIVKSRGRKPLVEKMMTRDSWCLHVISSYIEEMTVAMTKRNQMYYCIVREKRVPVPNPLSL